MRAAVAGPAVYRIVGSSGRLLYVGESENVWSRLRSYVGKAWGEADTAFSFVALPARTPSYQRHELENDLVGAHYDLTGAAPADQFRNLKAEAAEPTD